MRPVAATRVLAAASADAGMGAVLGILRKNPKIVDKTLDSMRIFPPKDEAEAAPAEAGNSAAAKPTAP